MEKNSKFLYIAMAVIIINLIIMNVITEKDQKRLLTEQNQLANGIMMYNEKRYAEAKELFEKFNNSRYSRDFVFNIYLARSYKEEGNFDQALDYYHNAYNINPAVLLEISFIEEIENIKDKKDAE